MERFKTITGITTLSIWFCYPRII